MTQFKKSRRIPGKKKVGGRWYKYQGAFSSKPEAQKYARIFKKDYVIKVVPLTVNEVPNGYDDGWGVYLRRKK